MLLEKIDSWTIECPKRVAHVYRESQMNYSDLKEASDKLAIWINHVYTGQGIQGHTPIIVYGHKENEMLVSFLAALKSGNPYVPIDISVPVDRVKQIICASGAKIVLSPRTIPDEIKDGGPDLILKENISLGDKNLLSSFAKQIPDEKWQVGIKDVCYIIYTSGSTGVPKGVQITLEALESYLDWVNAAYQPVEKQEVYLNQAPFSFDLSVMDLYMSLSTGGTLWSVDKEQIANPSELFSYLHDSMVSIWVSTPSFAEICLMDKSFHQNLLTNVKRFLFCGEVLTHDCATKLLERFPQAKIENLYGPTEATVAVTTVTITPEIAARYNPLPVGEAKPDCFVMVCDPEEITRYNQTNNSEKVPKILPEGEKGEIVIAGPNVSIGYINSPEQTKKVFFKWNQNGKMIQAYRTGDSGVWRDGQLFFLGRLDFQVKLHGYRIELGDIEEHLRFIDLVENAVVLPVERKGKIDYLQAFLITNHAVESEYTFSQYIRQQLKRNLPDYMIPRRIKLIEKMPMTPNGKVDRQALMVGR